MSKFREYATAILERACKTAAQGAVLAIGSESVQANALTLDWSTIGGFAAGGFVLSVLTSIATSGFGGDGPAAFGPETVE